METLRFTLGVNINQLRTVLRPRFRATFGTKSASILSEEEKSRHPPPLDHSREAATLEDFKK